MATRTIARMFDSYTDASAAVGALENAGFRQDEISLVANQAATTGSAESAASTAGTGTGATVGTVLGGGAGLLAGIGMMAIPGVGPLVAAGWLVATLTGAGVGAAAGGLLGALADTGLSKEDAEVYEEGIRRGGNLVTLRAEESRATEAEAILARHGAIDPVARGAEYRADGWTGNTATAPDGTPGNPPGTAVGRATDRVLGTNVSGAHPENEVRDPPGSAAGRATDRTLGTNISDAYPEHERDRDPGR